VTSSAPSLSIALLKSFEEASETDENFWIYRVSEDRMP
jgi:hypothetical protein